MRYHYHPLSSLSPGTGRTGTLLAIDMGRRAWELTGRVDVLQCVRQLREDRAGAIQTKDQYAFVYQVRGPTLSLVRSIDQLND